RHADFGAGPAVASFRGCCIGRVAGRGLRAYRRGQGRRRQQQDLPHSHGQLFLRLPPLPNSKGLRLSITRRLIPIQPNSPEKRPCSILGQRSITTVKPASSASFAASSLTTPSCIQTYLRPRRSFSPTASRTISGAYFASRNISTMSTGAG